VVLEERYIGKIEVVPVDTLGEVLEKALIGGTKKESLLKKLSSLVDKGGKPSLYPAGSTRSTVAPQ
jgi:Lon-like ATP-dependent protease